mgnify:CR=1 FL=1
MIKDLTSEQKHILLEEGTEPSGTSSLNYEKREGETINGFQKSFGQENPDDMLSKYLYFLAEFPKNIPIFLTKSIQKFSKNPKIILRKSYDNVCTTYAGKPFTKGMGN